MKTSVIGFPRIGSQRELKFASEKYFTGSISDKELEATAAGLRRENLRLQKEAGIDLIPSNDFSFYDGMLDTIMMINAVPSQYRELQLNTLDTYFAMARGYQGSLGDVKALAMKKWFNTNYHYIVPELDSSMEFKLTDSKLISEYFEGETAGIKTKPVIIGPFTFLKLAYYREGSIKDYSDGIIKAYISALHILSDLGVQWLQMDEPALVRDLDADDIALFKRLYEALLPEKNKLKVLLQTYFGDLRDCYQDVIQMDFDGIGLDFIEGRQTLELIRKYGFPKEKTLFAGMVNGKNIWRSDYVKSLRLISELRKYASDIVLSTSCSLLHVPFTIENETTLSDEISKHFAFAKEKLTELKELSELAENPGYQLSDIYKANQAVFKTEKAYIDKAVQARVSALTEKDFHREMKRSEREKLQKNEFKLPLLPTTTIGSFPQTADVKRNRSRLHKGEISREEYEDNIRGFIRECISFQESIGLDVLVHGEFERNDMVEFFGDNLSGFVFTEKAWVQSYGTRCVKPPIIFGDIKRVKPITLAEVTYAQSLTEKPVKGMLTGPVTILNWSFPREDISLREMAYQIGLAIQGEVDDLERSGIKIIQVDEAALKEKIPLRKAEWYSQYLDWAIPAFRLVSAHVKPETQIHTHMCYSEFSDIIKDIDAMDADVITFEACRSEFRILDAIHDSGFETEVGPGVYDIHSPRIPSVDEIAAEIRGVLDKVSRDKLWINPDCGLKTRGVEEAEESLRNMILATDRVRKELQES